MITQSSTHLTRNSCLTTPALAIQAIERPGISNQKTATMNAAKKKVLALGQGRIVSAATAIHRAGDLFRSVYVLNSGSAKRLMIQEDGREQVLGFPMPGDLIGIEAIDSHRHSTTVIALDLCALIEIPYEALEALAADDPTVGSFLFCTLSAALREEHGWLAALGLLNADERLAAFLVDLSTRFSVRGFSAHRFVLRMTRAEIGSFLGLTLETVSRVFSRFQKLGLLNVTRRDIELVDLAALSSLAQVSNPVH
jgi:CRP/FNR family transcriptional regulator, anaerobic regulatory protein